MPAGVLMAPCETPATLGAAFRKGAKVVRSGRAPGSFVKVVIPVSPRTPQVLVVDDDHGVREALLLGLAVEGFEVRAAPDGESALAAIADRAPAAVVLDVMMPGISGVEVVRRLRDTGRTLPVCMLSARDEVDDRVTGLSAGADDYVVKPFSVVDVSSKKQAMERLHQSRDTRPVVLADLAIEPARRLATRAGRDLGLTSREFDLLLSLGRHPGQVLSRAQLLAQVWGYTWDVDSNVVDVFIGYLRRKLEAGGEPRVLHTVRGVGFVLRA